MGPTTINGKAAASIDWKDSLLGDVPHFHHCRESVDKEHRYCQFFYDEEEEKTTCKTKFNCPVCGNLNIVAIHQDVNATIWCPAGHVTFLGDGVSVALNGF